MLGSKKRMVTCWSQQRVQLGGHCQLTHTSENPAPSPGNRRGSCASSRQFSPLARCNAPQLAPWGGGGEVDPERPHIARSETKEIPTRYEGDAATSNMSKHTNGEPRRRPTTRGQSCHRCPCVPARFRPAPSMGGNPGLPSPSANQPRHAHDSRRSRSVPPSTPPSPTRIHPATTPSAAPRRRRRR